jgi:hypothetical protein
MRTKAKVISLFCPFVIYTSTLDCKAAFQTPASVESLFPWSLFPSPIFNSLHNKIKGVPAVTATVAKQPLNQSSRRQRIMPEKFLKCLFYASPTPAFFILHHFSVFALRCFSPLNSVSYI